MTEPAGSVRRQVSSRDVGMLAGGVGLALVGVLVWTMWGRGGSSGTEALETPPAAKTASLDEVTVPPDILAGAGIETVSVATKPLVERLQATGVVEPNQERIQQVTPLVSGRVDRVDIVLGSRVQTGMALLTLSSPQIAELQGNLRGAEAKLAEAEVTLVRQKQLFELGAGAGKDLYAAEAEYRTAQAQAAQLQQSLQALGAAVPAERDQAPGTSDVTIRAPMTGTVIERAVNPGAWIEAGTPLVKIANLATVWVIVNVPEARLRLVRLGAPAEVRAPSLGTAALAGRVSYVGAELEQETRTARVRVEVPNVGEPLKIGMFVDVTIEGASEARAAGLTVPSEAIQRIGERNVVFVPTAEPERFEVRDVEVGDEIQGMRVVRHGLAAGDRVVTNGGFTLKSQLLKGQFGEDEEIAGQERK